MTSSATKPPRLASAGLCEHLRLEAPEVRRIVKALRQTILKAAPDAAEAIKFRVLCYYHANAYFGSIGGNICMIEIKDAKVLLSFIHGASLDDPARLLRGDGKFKRFLDIPDLKAAQSGSVTRLVKAAAILRPWD